MTATLEITPEYFVCGDFDSRNRYLRSDPVGQIAICSGITWEIANGVNISASQSNTPWCGYRFNIGGLLAVDARTQTYNGSTVGPVAVDEPSNTLTRVTF
jgi:hypothetical protein